MARRTLNKLSATFVAKTKEPGRHSDGGGLYLFIDADGRRRWIFMFTKSGKRTELGLGSARDLSLADARTHPKHLQLTSRYALLSSERAAQFLGPGERVSGNVFQALALLRHCLARPLNRGYAAFQLQDRRSGALQFQAVDELTISIDFEVC